VILLFVRESKIYMLYSIKITLLRQAFLLFSFVFQERVKLLFNLFSMYLGGIL
jgi:hypothetical protein